MGNVNAIIASQHKGHSILFIGDSHARGCITKVHDYIFRQNFVISGFVKPNSCTGTLSATADSDVKYLTKRRIY